MKIAGGFYLIPVIAICISVMKKNSIYYVTSTISPDFSVVQHYEKFKNWDALLSNPYMKLINVIVFIWLGGAVLFYIIGSLQGKLLVNKIISNSVACGTDKQAIMEIVKSDLNIKSKIGLYKSNVVHTPMLIGICNPKIIFPDISLSDEDWSLLIRHELVHYQNLDLLFKNLVDIIQKLQWFNPIIYFYAKFFYETSELVCDQMSLKNMNLKQCSRYAELLVLLSANLSFGKAIASFSNSNYQIIERRIYNIMKKKRFRSKKVTMLTAIALLLLCPTVSYASTWGTMYFQNGLIDNYNEKRSHEEDESDTNGDYIIMTENTQSSSVVTYSGNLNFRGSNQIDCQVTAKGEVRYNSVDLSVGSKVKFAISSENTTDSFRAGIMDEKGTRRYVSSKNGEVTTEFSISKAGTYIIYFQGMNTNNQDIHLYGFVNIN